MKDETEYKFLSYGFVVLLPCYLYMKNRKKTYSNVMVNTRTDTNKKPNENCENWSEKRKHKIFVSTNESNEKN